MLLVLLFKANFLLVYQHVQCFPNCIWVNCPVVLAAVTSIFIGLFQLLTCYYQYVRKMTSMVNQCSLLSQLLTQTLLCLPYWLDCWSDCCCGGFYSPTYPEKSSLHGVTYSNFSTLVAASYASPFVALDLELNTELKQYSSHILEQMENSKLPLTEAQNKDYRGQSKKILLKLIFKL